MGTVALGNALLSLGPETVEWESICCSESVDSGECGEPPQVVSLCHWADPLNAPTDRGRVFLVAHSVAIIECMFTNARVQIPGPTQSRRGETVAVTLLSRGSCADGLCHSLHSHWPGQLIEDYESLRGTKLSLILPRFQWSSTLVHPQTLTEERPMKHQRKTQMRRSWRDNHHSN